MELTFKTSSDSDWLRVNILTSSLVVWFEEVRYVWNPASPMMDHTEKKHTIASNIVDKVKVCSLSTKPAGTV